MRETVHDAVHTRQLLLGDWFRARHCQRNLVGKEVGNEVHHSGQHKGENRAALSSDKIAHEDKEQRESR